MYSIYFSMILNFCFISAPRYVLHMLQDYEMHSSVGNETLKNMKLFDIEFGVNAFDSQY